MKYLGIEPKKPRVAVFDFTSCEGCELQLANKEETLVDFLNSIEIVDFREISSARSDNYEIALIEGSVTRSDEIERLLKIRERAKTLVAIGACACFGGVNKLKNVLDLNETNHEVYGHCTKETLPARAIHELVKVDLEIPGCPICKEEVEQIIQHLVEFVAFCHFCSIPIDGVGRIPVNLLKFQKRINIIYPVPRGFKISQVLVGICRFYIDVFTTNQGGN